MMKFIQVETFSENPQVKILTLNRPEVKNAFHPEMIAELTSFFTQLQQDKETKFLIFKGEGSAFCSGADLNWMKNMVNYTYEENTVDSRKLWDMFESVYSCPTPLITIAHGAVFGGALGLLACSDYVVAEKYTQFCFSEVKLGLAPAVISGFISRKIPDAFYRPFMLSAEVFSAAEAQHIGLVQQCFEEKMEISHLVKKFSGNGTEAMRETKKLLNSLQDSSLRKEQLQLCTHVISERRMSAEGQERLNKFLNRMS